ncbi:multidrug ABC transporter ATP-binding protein [Pilimelia anulata]|uniref:Multidrug ABC transporter ATP-binding protein n=1 Tax=Pilimelia anulata TaxID=53371 RepID=A0A8J3FAY8_9ACTN|nr:ABC transporter ATP-binding protein [Pilimelia anulata]GGJ99162.1 multidrug ABC transporter ATP-binding protein [Pilimelia anulata]
MSTSLPVADAATVRRYAGHLLRTERRPLSGVLALHAGAAVTGLATPWLLGRLVEALRGGTGGGAVDRIALTIAGFVLAQAVFARFASYVSARFGEKVLARLREEFVERVLAIPLPVVERAGTGDLLTRTSRDVAALAHTVHRAVPETLIALVTLLLTGAALLLNSPLLALPALVVVPALWVSTRWYLRRAPDGYLAENASYSDITEGVAETVEGARTVEALRLGPARLRRTDADLRRSYRAERYTLYLRTVWFPVAETCYVLPAALTLLAGGWMYLRGWVGLGAVTAATLYVQQLVDPLDRLLSWLDELQVGGASLARLLGVARPTPDPDPAAGPVARAAPGGSGGLVVAGVRFGYVPGREVLHDVSLRLRPGERLAIVGPSGAGKSTLGRLLAGIHHPDAGTITLDGVPLSALPPERLRGEVALVTQEHHVFAGTLRDNVALARPDASAAEVAAALAAVDALAWAEALPAGVDTAVGTGAHPLPPARAQQVALARLVLADPHTLVLDEATSLIDPGAARQLERSLAAVLAGRTVVAIAHRLFSAHDADRVAVVVDGRIAELGTHDELIAAAGSYAALWRTWHGDAAAPRQRRAAGPPIAPAAR